MTEFMSRICIRLSALGLVLLLGPTLACMQSRPTSVLPTGPLGDPDPIAAIIERRPVLELADSQVTVLRVLKRDLDRANRPLREELERLGMLRPAESMRRLPDKPTKEQQEKARPVVAEMRENNRRARAAALEILTSTQRLKLDSLEKQVRSRQRDRQRQNEITPG